jgi:hypothetical protein
LIGALMVGDCSDCLCVRASRIWEFNDLQDETKLLHTDLVLLDEEVQFIFCLPTLAYMKRCLRIFICIIYPVTTLDRVI